MSESAKIIRDPVHNFIEITEPVILQIVDSKAFQRLRRIKQLGMVPSLYPGGEHSRFSHSLGTYHVAKKILSHLISKDQFIELIIQYEPVIKIAALTHDLGHGPFSHVFEPALKKSKVPYQSTKHENWTCRILQEDPEISKILSDFSEYAGDIQTEVIQAIKGEHPVMFVNQIISSQLDADRIDFILRDSLMTGSKYGEFDSEWLIQHFELHSSNSTYYSKSSKTKQEGPVMVFNATRGLSVLLQFLKARQNMYKHVYYHKFVRSQDALLSAIIERSAQLLRSGKIRTTSNNGYITNTTNETPDLFVESPFIPTSSSYKSLIKGSSIGVAEYLSFDDSWLIGCIKTWSEIIKDPLLKSLCTDFLTRVPFKAIQLSEPLLDKIMDNRILITEELDLNIKPEDAHFLVKKDTTKFVLYNHCIGENQQHCNQLIFTINNHNYPNVIVPLHPEIMPESAHSVEYSTHLLYHKKCTKMIHSIIEEHVNS